jgi:DNA-binding protein Fis
MTAIDALAGQGANGGPPMQLVPEGAVVLTSLDVSEAETKLIARALEVSRGNRTRAAELLGISIRTLRNKLNAPVTQ